MRETRNTRNTVAIVAMAVLGLAVASVAIELGDEMPKREVEMNNVDGEKLTLKEIGGEKGTLVIFVCRHCPFMQAFQDRMVELGNKYLQGIGSYHDKVFTIKS